VSLNIPKMVLVQYHGLKGVTIHIVGRQNLGSLFRHAYGPESRNATDAKRRLLNTLVPWRFGKS